MELLLEFWIFWENFKFCSSESPARNAFLLKEKWPFKPDWLRECTIFKEVFRYLMTAAEHRSVPFQTDSLEERAKGTCRVCVLEAFQMFLKNEFFYSDPDRHLGKVQMFLMMGFNIQERKFAALSADYILMEKPPLLSFFVDSHLNKYRPSNIPPFLNSSEQHFSSATEFRVSQWK